MTFTPEDAQAILSTANRLGVDPRTLGALMDWESNVDPNVWGGAGGQYRGLIQFGPGARKEVGLPDGPMTIAQQMPFVEKYMLQRGFQPGKHGPTELYRTVLVGNPGQSGTDSFGTNSDTAAARMKPGGDLYQRFSKRFDPIASSLGGSSSSIPAPSTATAAPSADPAASMLAGFANAQLNLADNAVKQQQQFQERQKLNQLLRSVVTAGRGGGGALAGFLAGMTSPRMAGAGLGLGSSGVEALASAMAAPANAIKAIMPQLLQPSSAPVAAAAPSMASTGSGDIGLQPANAIKATGGRLAQSSGTTPTLRGQGGRIPGGAFTRRTRDPDAEATGWDIVHPGGRGAPILAPVDLVITGTGFQGQGAGESGRGYGNWVSGEFDLDGKRHELLIGHLDEIGVKPGMTLPAGAAIGRQGITGRSFGTHATTHVNPRGGATVDDAWSALDRLTRIWERGR